MKYEALFSPYKVRGLELKNRIVLPGMMTKMVSVRSGEVTQTLIDYHVARVRGGCGLNITEACAIDKTTHGEGYMALYEPYHQIGFKRLVDAVHEEGGKICAQIWHGGTVATALLPREQKPMLTNDMTKEDIDYIISRFAASTKMAVESGVDAVEFHAGHAYLLHTFLSAAFNKREDEYGGSLENRARIILEVIEVIRENMPEDMPLFMRIDCFDDVDENPLSIEDIITCLKWANKKGVDVADVSRGNNQRGLIYEVPSIETPRGYNIKNFAKIREETGMPVVGVGRVNDPELANKIIEEGYADMIAIGRGQIADPEFANKAMRGEDNKIRKCVACNTGCFDAIMDPTLPTITCLRNPLVGKEGKEIKTTDNPKNVLIAGAGLGGLVAANMLKMRGHNPMLYEATDRVGGQFVLAGKAPGLEEMEEATVWEGNYARDLGVEVNLNSKVTPELIEELRPDEVIIATGATPFVPKNIKGTDNKNVYIYNEILDGRVTLIGNVVIVGGGATAIETALYLAKRGASCTILEQDSRVGQTLGWVRLINSMTSLYIAGVNCITGAICSEISKDGVFYLQNDETKKIECDDVVIAVGSKSNLIGDLKEKCDELGIPYYIVGDAKSPRLAMNATGEGMAAALRI